MIESETLIAAYPVAAAATALVAGVASSLSPCTVAAVPLVVGYVGGYADGSRRRAFLFSGVFVLGLALAFTGILSGVVFAPCSTPVMVGILALIGNQQDVLFGALLVGYGLYLAAEMAGLI
jgi:cytochrome c-type biogenesis protein